ncbi:MAG: hypothetical protein ACPGJS_09175 [Flammeovirgaceae bacterium]
MFDNTFDFKYKGHFRTKHQTSSSEIICQDHIYSFKDHENDTYLVHLEEYDQNIFAVKFHLKNHSNSDKKYVYLTSKGIPARIIGTCIQIMMDVLEKCESASFAVLGVADSLDKPNVITRRFKVYKMVLKAFFSDKTFEHLIDDSNSAYFMANRNSDKYKLLEAFNKLCKFYL